MAKSLEVPCEQCEQKRRELESAGNRVLGCEPKPGEDDVCVLVYEEAAVEPAETKRGPKAREGTKTKKKPRTRTAKVAARKKLLTKAKTKTKPKKKKTKARKARKT